jgi:predicted DsbA family dithiol-disulfide isomerase
MSEKPVVLHFSDILCVWAYVSNIRLERLIEKYADRVDFELRYCSVFPDAVGKIEASWANRGGFAGYGDHVRKVAAEFDHVEVHPDVWSKTRPASSTAPHMLLKAAQLAERETGLEADTPPTEHPSYRLSWALRTAFFRDGRDIADWQVQRECAESVGFDAQVLQGHLHSGAAAAALDRDILAAQKATVTGSPTFIMNGGRQVLYGNVGFKLLDANVEELLRMRGPGEASWC